MIAHAQTKGKTLRDRLSLAEFKKMGAETYEEYEQKIKRMNLVDLAAHAIKFDIAANVDRHKMEKSLLSVYKKAKAEYLVATEPQQVTELNMDKKQAVLDRLAFIGK